jgi:maltose/moltooligosaccharide transporter
MSLTPRVSHDEPHADWPAIDAPAAEPLAIVNMCVGFFGIQIGFALQNGNASRIFQTLGAEVDSLAILWIAAPLTGLLVQPLIGHLSDRTWGRFGRRRPYFLVGALLTTLALVFMPNSPSLWLAAATLWVMDASINITMEPFRAFVGDNLNDEQRTAGYAMQTVFIGAGAVFASCLPWVLSHVFHVVSTAPEGVTPDSVQTAFYIGAAIASGRGALDRRSAPANTAPNRSTPSRRPPRRPRPTPPRPLPARCASI